MYKYVWIRKYNPSTGKFPVVAKKFMTKRQLLAETSKPTVTDVFIHGMRPIVDFANTINPDVTVYHH